MNNKGFSIVEGLMAVGILGGAALGFASLSKNNSQLNQALELRYTKMDVEQSLRSTLINTSSCRCAFSGYTLAAGATTGLADFKLTDSSCSNPRMIIQDDQNVPNSTLKVENITVKNVTTSATDEVIGDLVVDWKSSVKGPPIKPSLLRNIRFSVNPSGSVTSCGLVPESDGLPVPSGYGKVFFEGHMATFTNASGAPIPTVIAGSDATGMILWFQTPAGRTTMMKFQQSSGTLVASRLGTWRPQFCYGHQQNMPYCAQQTHWGVVGTPNCSSALYWTYNGTSGNSMSLTSNTVMSAGPPIVYAPGTWPYKDTSVLPCSH